MWTVWPGTARWTADAFRLRYLIIASVGLATVVALVEIAVAARRVGEIVGPSAPRTLSGRYLTARLDDDCDLDYAAERWALYDPGRHLWAYALAPEGVTPYVFAFARYLPVWFRDPAVTVSGPPDWVANARITADEESTLARMQTLLGLRDQDLAADADHVRRMRVLAQVEAGRLPSVDAPIELATGE